MSDDKMEELRIDLVIGLSGLIKGLDDGLSRIKTWGGQVDRVLGSTGVGKSIKSLAGDGPGGIGGLVAAVVKGVAMVAMLPLRIVSGIVSVIPYVGGLASGFLSGVANLVEGVVNIVANVVGTIINLVGSLIESLVKAISAMVEWVAGAVSKVLKYLAAVGLGAAAALTYMGLKAAKSGDDLYKMAQRTGASVEQLSQMSYAMKVLGMELDDLTPLLRNMEMFLDKIGSNKQATETAKELGVRLRDGLGHVRPMVDLLQDYAVAIMRLRDPNERMLYAQRVFGRQAAMMMPQIMELAQHMGSLRQEAVALGQTWTTQEAVDAHNLEIALNRLKAVAWSLVVAFVRPFFPGAARGLNGITQEIAKLEPKLESLGKSAAHWFDIAWQAVSKFYGEVKVFFSTHEWKWENFRKAFSDLVSFVWDELKLVKDQFIQITEDKSGKITGAKAGPWALALVAGVRWVLDEANLLFHEFLWSDAVREIQKFIGYVLEQVGAAIQRVADKMREGDNRKAAEGLYNYASGHLGLAATMFPKSMYGHGANGDVNGIVSKGRGEGGKNQWIPLGGKWEGLSDAEKEAWIREVEGRSMIAKTANPEAAILEKTAGFFGDVGKGLQQAKNEVEKLNKSPYLVKIQADLDELVARGKEGAKAVGNPMERLRQIAHEALPPTAAAQAAQQIAWLEGLYRSLAKQMHVAGPGGAAAVMEQMNQVRRTEAEIRKGGPLGGFFDRGGAGGGSKNVTTTINIEGVLDPKLVHEQIVPAIQRALVVGEIKVPKDKG